MPHLPVLVDDVVGVDPPGIVPLDRRDPCGGDEKIENLAVAGVAPELDQRPVLDPDDLPVDERHTVLRGDEGLTVRLAPVREAAGPDTRGHARRGGGADRVELGVCEGVHGHRSIRRDQSSGGQHDARELYTDVHVGH